MQLFAIFGVSQPDKLGQIIAQKYAAENRYDLGNGQWIVADEGVTAKQVSDKIEITTDSSISNGIVLAWGGYFGRRPSDLWEWVKVKLSG